MVEAHSARCSRRSVAAGSIGESLLQDGAAGSAPLPGRRSCHPYHAAIDASSPAPTAPAPLAAATRFPTFEGLRALCALGVLVFHAGSSTGLTTGPGAATDDLASWVQHLNVGVSVFFVLSGFLLFRPFVLAHLADLAPPPTGSYLWRRLVRIYPAYWLALAGAVVLVDVDLGGGWSTLRYAALIQIYWGDTVLGGLTQAWSLCTEVSFYLFLPLWAAALRRTTGSVTRRVRVHSAALVVLYLVGVSVRAQLRAGDHALGYATLPANADLFAIGMALAVASAAATVRGRPPGGLARTVGDLPAASWAAALCCYAGVVALRYPFGFDPPTVAQEVLRQVLFGLIAGLLVAPGVFGAQDRGLIRRLLRGRPLVWAGVVSYGVYLWHLTVIDRLLQWRTFVGRGGLVALIGLATVVSVAVASASWLGVEAPLLRRARTGRGRSRGGGRSGSSSRVDP